MDSYPHSQNLFVCFPGREATQLKFIQNEVKVNNTNFIYFVDVHTCKCGCTGHTKAV